MIAAGLHPIVKALANGSHYGSTLTNFIPGVDGVGHTGTERRLFRHFAKFRTFSERALAAPDVRVPEGLDPVTIKKRLCLPGLRLPGEPSLSPGRMS